MKIWTLSEDDGSYLATFATRKAAVDFVKFYQKEIDDIWEKFHKAAEEYEKTQKDNYDPDLESPSVTQDIEDLNKFLELKPRRGPSAMAHVFMSSKGAEYFELKETELRE